VRGCAADSVGDHYGRTEQAPRLAPTTLHRSDPCKQLEGDDVQWLDSSSESALAFALRRLHEQPVALLLARRVGDGVELSELELAIEPERVERLRVGPLSLGSVQRLLQTPGRLHGRSAAARANP
jgi:hypothetical protein